MNKILKLTMMLVFISSLSLFAQNKSLLPPESKHDYELECKEADARIQDFQSRIEELTRKLNATKDAVTKSEADLDALTKELADCEKAILDMVGATNAELEAYRQRLGVLEGKVRQMKNLSNDALADRRAEVVALENELNELRGNKLSCIPEFYNKIIALAKDIKGLYREKKVTGYTVGTWAQDRDCLWNISGKMDIYGDPFQWPKIWQANTDIIRNPDIIHPGQVLQIPVAGPKTDDESKAERRYWRNKRAAAAAAEQESH